MSSKHDNDGSDETKPKGGNQKTKRKVSTLFGQTKTPTGPVEDGIDVARTELKPSLKKSKKKKNAGLDNSSAIHESQVIDEKEGQSSGLPAETSKNDKPRALSPDIIAVPKKRTNKKVKVKQIVVVQSSAIVQTGLNQPKKKRRNRAKKHKQGRDTAEISDFSCNAPEETKATEPISTTGKTSVSLTTVPNNLQNSTSEPSSNSVTKAKVTDDKAGPIPQVASVSGSENTKTDVQIYKHKGKFFESEFRFPNGLLTILKNDISRLQIESGCQIVIVDGETRGIDVLCRLKGKDGSINLAKHLLKTLARTASGTIDPNVPSSSTFATTIHGIKVSLLNGNLVDTALDIKDESGTFKCADQDEPFQDDDLPARVVEESNQIQGSEIKKPKLTNAKNDGCGESSDLVGPSFIDDSTQKAYVGPIYHGNKQKIDEAINKIMTRKNAFMRSLEEEEAEVEDFFLSTGSVYDDQQEPNLPSSLPNAQSDDVGEKTKSNDSSEDELKRCTMAYADDQCVAISQEDAEEALRELKVGSSRKDNEKDSTEPYVVSRDFKLNKLNVHYPNSEIEVPVEEVKVSERIRLVLVSEGTKQDQTGHPDDQDRPELSQVVQLNVHEGWSFEDHCLDVRSRFCQMKQDECKLYMSDSDEILLQEYEEFEKQLLQSLAGERSDKKDFNDDGDLEMDSLERLGIPIFTPDELKNFGFDIVDTDEYVDLNEGIEEIEVVGGTGVLRYCPSTVIIVEQDATTQTDELKETEQNSLLSLYPALLTNEDLDVKPDFPIIPTEAADVKPDLPIFPTEGLEWNPTLPISVVDSQQDLSIGTDVKSPPNDIQKYTPQSHSGRHEISTQTEVFVETEQTSFLSSDPFIISSKPAILHATTTNQDQTIQELELIPDETKKPVLNVIHVNANGWKEFHEQDFRRLVDQTKCDILVISEAAVRPDCWLGSVNRFTYRKYLPFFYCYVVPCYCIPGNRYAGIHGMVIFSRYKLAEEPKPIQLIPTKSIDHRQIGITFVTSTGERVNLLGLHYKSGEYVESVKRLQLYSSVAWFIEKNPADIHISIGDYNCDPSWAYFGEVELLYSTIQMKLESHHQLNQGGRKVWTHIKGHMLDQAAVRTRDGLRTEIRLLGRPEYWVTTDHPNLIQVLVYRDTSAPIVTEDKEDARPFHCPHCGRGYKRHCDLERHLPCNNTSLNHLSKDYSIRRTKKRRTNLRRFSKCEKCERVLSRNYLRRHKRMHTGLKPFRCVECDMTFSHKSNLIQHKRRHTGLKPYKCDQCEMAFARKSALTRHKRRRHTGLKPYKCDNCEMAFAHKSNLIQHKIRHTGLKPYKCDNCEMAFAHKSNLIQHKKRHTGLKPYKCDQCEMAFARKSALTRHKKRHSGLKPYKCDQCEMAFAQKSNLIQHKKRHTGLKPYKCDQCEMAFAEKSALIQHKNIHTGLKPFRCDQCEMAFGKKSNLTRHKRRHTGQKPYKCHECKMAFTHQSNLIQHKKRHTGLKPYKCDQCEMAFAQKSNLIQHKIRHTGLKPYKCDQCEMTFTHQSTLIQHKKRHTGLKPFRCDQCEMAFGKKSNLTRHKRSRHTALTFKA